MLINGEKFACEACVRGHRVSSCQHQDRPLIHVNKKGRPVSQCPHCRGLRRARAQHVKCDCAEKAHSKEDCPHETGEIKEPHTCCCGHGARCTCSLKKDHHLDTVPEDIPQPLQHAVQPKETHKPRLSSMNSHESKMTVFTNGHHKPVHKINDAHNMCGAPYKVPHRNPTLQGHREIAQKSSDSLPLMKSAISGHGTPTYHDSITSAPQDVRQVKSEHNSPVLQAVSGALDDSQSGLYIPPLEKNAYSYSPFDSHSPPIHQNGGQQEFHFPEQFPDSLFMTYDQAHEYEPPPPSAGLNEVHPEIDWSTFNFTDTSNAINVNNNGYIPSQPPSYASLDHFSHLSHPGLTSSSGELSEIEDFVPVSKPEDFRIDSNDALNDFSSIGGDDTASDAYRLSTASSYIGMPQAQMLANIKDTSDIDEYLQQAEALTRQMALQNSQQQQQQQQQQQSQPQPRQLSQSYSVNSSQNAMLEHPYTIQEAQNYAHMDDSGKTAANHEQELAMPMNGAAEDPMWSCSSATGSGRDGTEDDDDWIR